MDTSILEIQPCELEFKFELKKQSSCSVRLINNSDRLVAFKVKTTSPKRYSVEPSINLIEPKSTCVLTVIMQAPLVAPPDMQSKDKFLIQSTVVPFGTTKEDIRLNIFNKESRRFIKEHKLRVVFFSPSHSPVLLSNSGAPEQEATPQAAVLQDDVLRVTGDICQTHTVGKDLKHLKLPKELQKLNYAKDVEEFKSAKGIDEMNLKLTELQLKLKKTEITITRLREDTSSAIVQSQRLKRELAMWKGENGFAEVKVGFPFLFVCFVGLVGWALGYLFQSHETKICSKFN